jgi:hypothetical protein
MRREKEERGREQRGGPQREKKGRNHKAGEKNVAMFHRLTPERCPRR